MSDAGTATPTQGQAPMPLAAANATATVDEIVARYYDLEHDSLVADAALYCELAREAWGVRAGAGLWHGADPARAQSRGA